MTNRTFRFPDYFMWGSGTSSHPVEGDNLYNDWWEWEQMGKVKERSGKACDHWNRFREDFQLAKSLHHNAHRFSVEWSRIEPMEGEFDVKALEHYREVIAELKRGGLEPIVTLHHFTLPIWIARRGGWFSNDTAKLFARYARKVVQTIGDTVRYWVTINEPEIYIFKSYLTGEWPPGERASYDKAYRLAAHLLKGHVLAYAAIKEVKSTGSQTLVGMAKHTAIFTPCNRNSLRDKVSVWFRNLVVNHVFIKALIEGRMMLPGFFHVRLPRGQTLDFIGLNYYTRSFIRNDGFGIPGIYGEVCPPGHHPEVRRRNSLNWEIYPEGLFQIVRDFSKYKLPLLITENGVCTDRDEERSQFVYDHLKELARAMDQGAPVIGYLYWSLLDNFEWADGFAPRFGLVEVDYQTQARTIRPSGMRYAEICRSGLLPMDS
ncbi:MAG: glycoside hydrolase family 1 protein [Candidatus Omnitrophica bacterium]|nr:glycoside hydrolase family 1 protein [Candidatus Omnitrophota bacterium]